MKQRKTKRIVLLITVLMLSLLLVTGCNKSSQQSDFVGQEETSAATDSSDQVASDTPSLSDDFGLEHVTYELDKLPAGPNINAAPVADLKDLYALTEVYVWPLTVNGGAWFQSWANPSEIPADQLIYICAFNEWVKYDSSNDSVQPFAPAQEVEAALQKHFDVTTDYLKSASYYNVENNTYPQAEGGGGWAAVAMSAKQEGNQIVIQVGNLPPDETQASEMGILKLELTDENVVRYLSYELTEQESENDLVTSTVATEMTVPKISSSQEKILEMLTFSLELPENTTVTYEWDGMESTAPIVLGEDGWWYIQTSSISTGVTEDMITSRMEEMGAKTETFNVGEFKVVLAVDFVARPSATNEEELIQGFDFTYYILFDDDSVLPLTFFSENDDSSAREEFDSVVETFKVVSVEK